ncbi:hypothetical protein [Yoonia sediminilitoris]|uniref:Uncharacterized protein n=1 Tax=Yoonia sediminilitoris TaxID=1286148 RepID=A0A2T6KPL3_9RHOB|nr:hypothetical protein [Yoonia sediminilitoris]PUB18499.1 hypothetical protein C8N45_10183 [Yoonia sediminilitoris]RCW98667.1 hypothetical protein DFP92_10183 [Yoonia sediminilitoris]
MNRFFVFAKYLVIAIGVGAVLYLVLDHKSSRIKILVVHSYGADMPWVNSIDAGIDRAVNDWSGGKSKLEVRRHYMNLLGQNNCNFYRNAASDVRIAISFFAPSYVIIVDDLGQTLVGFNQLRLTDETERRALAETLTRNVAKGRCDLPEENVTAYFGLDTPQREHPVEIVFAGINGDETVYGYGRAENVQGIRENKNYDALFETIGILAESYLAVSDDGEVAGIQMLNDGSVTGQSENTQMRRYRENNPDAIYPISDPLAAGNLAAWQESVRAANAANQMLLIANYKQVRGVDGNPVPAEELIAWTEQMAKLPVLGANTDFVADGGLMTVATSGIEQGVVAMNKVLALISGDDGPEECRTREVCTARQYLLGMNQTLVRKRNLSIPSIYEAFSREIGTFIGVQSKVQIADEGIE